MAFKPGQSGNAKGKPKGLKNTSRLDDIKRWQKKGFFRLADKAIELSLLHPKLCSDMARWLYEQKNGKAPQAMQISGEGGGPVMFKSNVDHSAENEMLKKLLEKEKAKNAGV